MSNSWIDRDELEQLVGACSKKKRRKDNTKAPRKENVEEEEEQAALSAEVVLQVGDEPVVEEVADIELEADVEEEIEIKVEVEAESEVEAEKEVEIQAKVGEETETPFEIDAEADEESASEIEFDHDAEEDAIDLEIEADSENEIVPDIELDEEVGFVSETERGTDPQDNILADSIPGLLISSPLGVDDEELVEKVVSDLSEPDEALPVFEAKSDDQVIENVVVEDVEESDSVDERDTFLGESLALSDTDEFDERSEEAIRAVQSLVEAREQVESNNLLKSELPTEEIDSEPEPELEAGELPAALRLRFDRLVSHLQTSFSASRFAFFDDMGNELYRSDDLSDRDELTSGPSPWRLLENQLSSGVTQVTSGDGDHWTCLVRGNEPAAHMALRFVLDEPAEAEQLLRLPALLAEALYRTNPSDS